MIQREPFHDNGELAGLERELIRPLRMRTDRFLVKASELEDVAQAASDFLAKLPGGVAGRSVEVDVGMPRYDGINGGRVHGWRKTREVAAARVRRFLSLAKTDEGCLQ